MVNLIGGGVGFVVGLIVVITAFREFTPHRKRLLERLIAGFTLLGTAFVIFNIFAANRQGELQSLRLDAASKAARSAEQTVSGLQRAQEDRQITSEQAEVFIKKCKALAPGEPVIVAYNAGDEETFRFAREINGLLRKAGFSVNGDNDMTPVVRMGPPYSGVIVDVTAADSADNKVPVHAGILQQAFTAANIEAERAVGLVPTGRDGAVGVMVGLKKR